jgi:bla regulator protein BlaR1
MPAPHNYTFSLIPLILRTAWTIGFAILVRWWWLRWRRIRAAVRTASPLHLSIDIPVVTSADFGEPGVFGIVRPVLLSHPLVWWRGARLMGERERACDQEVLRSYSEPEVYAEGILKVCERYPQSSLQCVAGARRRNLKSRGTSERQSYQGSDAPDDAGSARRPLPFGCLF